MDERLTGEQDEHRHEEVDLSSTSLAALSGAMAPEPMSEGGPAVDAGSMLAPDVAPDPVVAPDPAPDDAPPAVRQDSEKDPSDWVTGDEPMTGPQRSYLETLSREAGDPFDETLTKADASRRIDELQQKTGRGQAAS